MKDISKIISIRQFTRLLVRFNFVIFIVLVTSGLIMSVMILNSILARPYADNNGSNGATTTFDQQTINRLNKLNVSTNNTNYQTLPSGRTNPFSE